MKTERQKRATRLAPLFFEIVRRDYLPLRFYFRFLSVDDFLLCWMVSWGMIFPAICKTGEENDDTGKTYVQRI